MAPLKTCLLASGERWTTFILASCCYSWRTTKRKWFYSVCVCSQPNSHLEPPLSFAQRWPPESSNSSPGAWTEPPVLVVIGESGGGNWSIGLWRHCTACGSAISKWLSESKTRDRKREQIWVCLIPRGGNQASLRTTNELFVNERAKTRSQGERTERCSVKLVWVAKRGGKCPVRTGSSDVWISFF